MRLLTGAGIAHQQHVHLASNVAAARLLPLHAADQLRMAADKRATISTAQLQHHGKCATMACRCLTKCLLHATHHQQGGELDGEEAVQLGAHAGDDLQSMGGFAAGHR